jgi:hypothetical protein
MHTDDASQLDGSKLGEESRAALVVRLCHSVILASQSQLKFWNFICSLTFLALHLPLTVFEWKIDSDLTGPPRPVPYTSFARATY